MVESNKMENHQKNNNLFISIIVPVLNEEGNILELTNRLIELTKKYKNYEIIYVDDGSSDNSLDIIKNLRKTNKHIHYLSFSRNFGHQNALKAGIDCATGDCVISIDGDLQHPPELIPVMIEKWKEGFDVVYTLRKDYPKIPLLKKITTRLFYKIMNKFSDISIDQGTADFRLLDKKIVDILRTMNEKFLFFRGMIRWLGFKQTSIEYVPDERYHGRSKYSAIKMMRLAITGITSFSVRPLRISTMVGSLIALVAFIYGIYALYIKLFTNKSVQGWTSVLVTVTFIGGIQLIMIGILGEYLGKLFIESKKRPNYIIKESSFI